MTFEDNISKNNIILPEAKGPVGSYIATKIIDKLLFISGQISIDENGKLIKGKIGENLTTEDGYNAASRCGLSIISQAKKACNGDLSQIDLPKSTTSGLKHAIEVLKNVESIKFTKFGAKDVVRHSLVQEIVEAYDNFE